MSERDGLAKLKELIEADELSHDIHVSVGYAEPAKGSYVAVAGQGRILRDKALAAELWTFAQRAWYPQGLDDEHLSILRVTPERAEYWEAPGRITYLLAAAEAIVSGKPATIAPGRKLR